MRHVVLIPTAKQVPPELAVEFGAVPSCLLPMQGRSALAHIASAWREQGFDVLALAHEGADLVQQEAEHLGDGTDVLDVGATGSLAETILRGLEGAGDVGLLGINFGDTLVGYLPKVRDGACVAHTVDLFRWTVGRLGPEGLEVVDKGKRKAGQGWSVFVGVFWLSEPARFQALLVDHMDAPRQGLDPFFSACVAYHDALGRPDDFLVSVDDWRDFGHVDTYYRSRRSFGSGARHFNSVVVDTTRGVVTKRSADPARLVDEINWYLKLPPQLAHIAPRLFDYSRDPDEPSLDMEFYSYPPLNELYLFGAWDIGVWARVLEAIGELLGQLGQVAYTPPVAQKTASRARHAMYVEKTEQRLRRITTDAHLAAFWQEEVRINGEACMGLPAVLKDLKKRLASEGLLSEVPLTVIHGDLCMSNILYDRRNAIVRVIDPRGRYGGVRGYGDPLYDLAKLAHSFLGCYDLLVAGMFELDLTDDGVTFEVRMRDEHRIVQELFLNRLSQWSGGRTALVRRIESLLFLSMVPLHSDRPRSQQAYLATGLRLYTQLNRTSDGSGTLS